MQKKFIEYDLPLYAISEEAAHEKNVHIGLPPQFHVWWARKPLVSSRATTLASLLKDPGPENPEDRENINDILEKISTWDIAKNEKSKALQRARDLIDKQYGINSPKILDPFAGGGSIPLETLRLGAKTYVNDQNPVAVLLERATVRWPQKFGTTVDIPGELSEKTSGSESLSLDKEGEEENLLLFLVERWANKLLDGVKEEISNFYPKESGEKLVGESKISEKEDWVPVSYYYNRTIPCQNPNCKAAIPLTSNYWLARKKNKRIAYRPIVDEKDTTIDYEILAGEDLESAIEQGFNPSDGTVTNADATCPVCGQVTQAKKVRELAKDGKMDQRMVAVVFYHPDQSGKRYRLARKKDIETLKGANDYLEKKLNNWNYMDSALPNEEFPHDPRRIAPPLYGMKQFHEIFNHRQKLSLVTFMQKIRSFSEPIKEDINKILTTNESLEIREDELIRAVVGYLGLLFSRQVSFSSSLCNWHSHAELSTQSFGRQALSMSWDYSEVNPLSGSTGSFATQMHYMLTSLENFFIDSEPIEDSSCSSATELDYKNNSFDAIITDPPYYDDVPYAALSDFFYVWLKRAVGEYFPELFSTPVVTKSDEAIMEPARHDSKEKARKFFEEILADSFQEIHRVLKQGGVATIVYAYKTTEGWETMIKGLVESGFKVTASWPIHTEMKTRLGAAHSAALASSIYMVCRKTEKDSVGFWKDLKPKISNKVEAKLDQFWKEGIVGGDLFISAIGPGMEIFSQYEEVQKYSGEEVSTRELLTFIRSITTDFVVNRLLKEASPSEIDKESQFYLAYRWTYLDNKVEYDAARKIASGMGVDIEKLDNNYGFVKKTRKYVRVYGPNDRTDYDGKIDEIEIKSMVDAMHKSLLLWEDGRKDEINELLAETGYAEQGSFWQFCQAVSESLVQGNNEKKKLEGFLMGRDKYVKSAKEMNEQAEKTKDMFEEE